MALKITQAADYAIRSMLYIASLPEDRPILKNEVAESQDIPRSFTAKILRVLVHAGLLKSTRGVKGGFTLARPASEINMLEIVEATDGPIRLAACAIQAGDCEQASNCPSQAVWNTVQEQITATLRGANLEDLVSAPRRHGRVNFVSPPVAKNGTLSIGEPPTAKPPVEQT